MAERGGRPALAAVDWGTSSFRLWLVDEAGTVLAARRSDEGLARGAAEGFATILERHLGALAAPAGLPALVCGMAGSRQGWREAPYVDTPARLADLAAFAVAAPDALRPVWLMPGIAQRDPARPDVMRGEETQLLGAFGARANGVACLPGTHAKWARMAAGRVVAFATHMTGELYGAIGRSTILSHALEAGTGEPGPAFEAAVGDALADPGGLTAALFGIRAGQLLGQAARTDGAARLSGLLIGTEIAHARAGLAPGETVTLIAAGALGALYRRALAVAGLAVRPVDAETAVRDGLLRAWTAHGRTAEDTRP
ncbi:2-dehydro-3-deoxygalactonokinase [Aquibium sp. A9E412]|uniref:2-dehydro-3-deoxygalactonokinase n=1 Tax=Aquibium sp. A9E412 TaxID=2976767 RepID=UPI0025AFAD93|nr:2-dehydro-3-deoxygalactonokinase [Aquibium sp. A9E412]MDN2566405.1 2-dehydro-3-deoxygalactonokinase [Aquibium sp. A9E412]